VGLLTGDAGFAFIYAVAVAATSAGRAREG